VSCLETPRQQQQHAARCLILIHYYISQSRDIFNLILLWWFGQFLASWLWRNEA